jgi:hypothetical protein
MRMALGIALFAISISCFGSTSHQDEGKDSKGKAETSQKTPENAVTINNFPAQAAEAKSEKNEPRENSSSAEERIALWTKRLVYVTFALAFFTLLLWWTTLGLLGDAKETSRKQLRAYVTMDDIGVFNVAAPILPKDSTIKLSEVPANLRIPESPPWATGWIRNAGQTPALDVIHWGNIVFDTYPVPQNSLEPNLSTEGFTKSVIGREVKTSKTYRMFELLSPSQTDQLRSGTAAIYVFGIVSYRDIFGDPHYTTYRLIYHRDSGIIGLNGNLTICEHGNNVDRDYENTKFNRLKRVVRKLVS